MAGTEDLQAALEKNQNALQDIEHMITSLNDVRSSVHHVFHILQGRTELESGAAFREHARFTYSALECLAKLAIGSDGVLNDIQAVELPKLQGPSPISLETKQKEAQQGEKTITGLRRVLPGETGGTIVEQKSQEYHNLSIDDTLRWFSRATKKSGRKVHASRQDSQPSMPFSTVKISVSGVMHAYIVMETNGKGRCTSVSRLIVFGTGEENSIWEDSSHLVFKKITQIAVGAVDYFTAKEPRSLLGLTLEWLSAYSTLFTAPCSGCGKHLFFDSQQFKHLPPTLYTYDQPTKPFHPQCLA
ncbi:mediator complex subunit 27-domain-containing protein [Gamsiella multidivaricata]|uniref:mediator complex subunit 27-domain-containing protein n=1 Tax=Gamsiella multidivaricata TaxID=101098 RepID=UPI00221E7859|nr:mediator complex subunit 27-domain-containing protein [Gamsiella multidivaricata]KAI7820858.1 mediator complex subunit 27-domain-containing protein [Gamsiella multidivaricata]